MKKTINLKRFLRKIISGTVSGALFLTFVSAPIPGLKTVHAAETYTVMFPVDNGMKIAYYQGDTPEYGGYHRGIDIHAKGDDTIYCAKNATVTKVSNSCPHISGYSNSTKTCPCGSGNATYGNYVFAKDSDGILYIYAHMVQNSIKVKSGDTITAGQVIGKMGSSGAATGKHLHFEMNKGSTVLNTNPTKATGTYTYYGNVNYYPTSATPTELTILNPVLPSGKLEKGKPFDLKGIITSPADIKSIAIGVVNRDYSKTAEFVEKNIDATKIFDIANVDRSIIFDNLKEGYYKFIVKITDTNGKTSTLADKDFQIGNPEPVTLKSISVSTMPLTTIYEDNSEFVSSGMKLSAVYTDGTSKEISEGYELKYDFSKAGDTEVQITWEGKTTSLKVKVQDVFKGKGTEKEPYEINDLNDLIMLSSVINNQSSNNCYYTSHYIQNADIDLDGVKWIPIGRGRDDDDTYNNTTRMFWGYYNGNNHSVKNLSIKDYYFYSGLFGVVKTGKVFNLEVEGAVTPETENEIVCGGITGALQYSGSIEGCSFNGDVSGTIAGGIAGECYGSGDIVNCWHTGKIAGKTIAGGITGKEYFWKWNTTGDASHITNCYHSGEITGESAGAICGICEYYEEVETSVIIDNCYTAAGSVSEIKDNGATSENTKIIEKKNINTLAEKLDSEIFSDSENGPVFKWQIKENSSVNSYKLGDINGNGAIDITDLSILSLYLIGEKELDDASRAAADVDKDGKLHLTDLATLRQFISHVIEKL